MEIHMKRIKNRVKPFYAVAALWLIWSFVFPLSGLWSFAILIGLSISLAKWVKKKWPASEDAIIEEIEKREAEEKQLEKEAKTRAKLDAINAKKREREQAEAEAKRAAEEAAQRRAQELAAKKAEIEAQNNRRPRTGDEQIDKMLDEEEMAILELKRLDEAIPDEKLSAQIVHLEEVTEKIVNCIVEHPEKKNEVRKFFSYYLPTIIKFLNAYDRMDSTGISGANIDGTKGNIEEIMDTALAAFDKQLDALYRDDALDITTDIQVMQNVLKQEGLMEENQLFLN